MNEEREKFERLMMMLNRVTEKMGSMHEPAFDYGTGIPQSRAEIHTIKAIKDNPGINVTGLAEVMGVTKGAISQILNKLVNKGLVIKKSADDNAKEILPELTEVGLQGYENHERFHTLVFDMVREYYGERFGTELDKFMSVMSDLNHIIDRFEGEGLER